MPAFTTIAMIIGAGAAVEGTIASIKSSKSEAAAQQQQNDVATRRSRRRGIREAQLRRAQSVASAGAAGAGGSSGAIGGIGSLGSQLGADLGFGSQMGALSNIITQQQQRAQMWGGIASLGGSLYSYGQSTQQAAAGGGE